MIIAAVGDLLLPREAKALQPLDSTLLGALDAADLVLANLEVPFTERRNPQAKLIALRSAPQCVSYIGDLGVHAVSLANNHALDQGRDGLLDTLMLLREKRIPFTGAGRCLSESLEPAWLAARGQRVAFFSVATTLPGVSAATPDMPGVAPVRVTTSYELSLRDFENPGRMPIIHTVPLEDDVAAVVASIRAARAEADTVIVAIHWGVPMVSWLAEYQRPLAHRLIDAGGDVILGHHPHCLQGVELYRGHPILYSVSHFICHPHQVEKFTREFRAQQRKLWRLSCLTQLSYDGSNWQVSLLPVALDKEGWPRVAGQDEQREALVIVSEQSADLGVAATLDAGRILFRGVG